MKLNDIKCKNAKPFPAPTKSTRKIADGHGLALWIAPNGSKYWRFIYRIHGKQKTLALGVYSEVSLQEAREKLTKYRKMVRDGIDPGLERKRAKVLAKVNSDNTFKSVAEEWFENRKERWTLRYREEVITRLQKDIFPHIGERPIREIDPPLLLFVIRKIEKRSALELARRQLQKCGEIFRYAIAVGKVDRDPSADIKEALKPVKKGHYAALDVEELPEFLQVLEKNEARLFRGTRNALKLMLLTFVRTGELIDAHWEEIDFEKALWTIPAERMKMKKEHIVPLSRQAIEILKDQKEITNHWPHVFPSVVRPRKTISNNTLLGALARLGYQGRMTGHGFRALAMSAIKQELGYRHEVIDRQLAHVHKNKIDKAYDRAMFLEDRKIMMQEWADYIDVEEWTESNLALALDKLIADIRFNQDERLAWCLAHINHLTQERGIALSVLWRAKFLLGRKLTEQINKMRAEEATKSYQQYLFAPEAKTEVSFENNKKFRFFDGMYDGQKPYKGTFSFPKHYLEIVPEIDGKDDGGETRCALAIDSLAEVKHWLRNISQHPNSFRLPLAQGWTYPDFVVELNDGRILVVEYKGADRFDNPKEVKKRLIGQLWENSMNGKGLYIMAVKDDNGKDVRTQIMNQIND